MGTEGDIETTSDIQRGVKKKTKPRVSPQQQSYTTLGARVSFNKTRVEALFLSSWVARPCQLLAQVGSGNVMSFCKEMKNCLIV